LQLVEDTLAKRGLWPVAYLDDEPIDIPGVGRRRRQVAVAALVLLAGAGVLGARAAKSHGATFRAAATASEQRENATTRRLREVPPPPDLPQETAEPAETASHSAAADGHGPPLDAPSPMSHGALAVPAPASAANAPNGAGKAQATVVARPAAPPSPAIRVATPPVASPAPKGRIVRDTPF
jgi:hypothetical protein